MRIVKPFNAVYTAYRLSESGSIEYGAAYGVELTAEQIAVLGVGLIVAGVISLIIEIVVLVFASKAIKAVGDGAKSNAPHIIMIVIGVIGSDIFYLLGGIFGLVSESQDNG